MFLLHFSVALAQSQPPQPWPPPAEMALAPHMRLCTPRQRFEWMGDNPPSKRMYFLGGLRVCVLPSKCSFVCSGDDELPQHRSILRAIHNLNSPQNYTACLGSCRPSIRRISLERKASCGALGGHFCQRQPWLAMVVLVNVGHWWLTSDWPTVGIVKTVCRSIFYSYVDPIHSWHLTWQLNKEDLDLRTWAFSCFLCPNFHRTHNSCLKYSHTKTTSYKGSAMTYFRQ